MSSRLLARIGLFAVLLPACLSTSSVLARPTANESIELNTWSIVAADPETGDVGVAAASCVPDIHADAIAALVPGKGAAAVQAFWSLENRDKVYELLLSGKTAREIVRQVTDPGFDTDYPNRQYGIVTIHDGPPEVEAFTGAENLVWAGGRQDVDLAVTVQGNILVDESVVADALQAFQSDDGQGRNALPDRLMRALEAGSAAGGDSRCNNDQTTQTAATAVILVARGIDAPYTAENMGVTDMGTADAPWLAISVAEARFGPNPLVELRQRYDSWRQDNILDTDRARLDPTIVVVAVLGLLVLLVVLLFGVKRMNA